MPQTTTAQEKARNVVYIVGFSLVALIALAATWAILRDRDSNLRAAELHLDNFAVVLTEHTRLALRQMPNRPSRLASVMQSL